MPSKLIDMSEKVRQVNEWSQSLVKELPDAGFPCAMDPFIKPANTRSFVSTIYCDDVRAICREQIVVDMDIVTPDLLLRAISDAYEQLKKYRAEILEKKGKSA